MVLPGLSYVLHLVLVTVPIRIDVRVIAQRNTFASPAYTSSENRHICGFYVDDIAHKLYDCGSKDFLTTF